MPFLTGFGKRKAIQYGTTFPGSNLTDFPVLVAISSDSDIAAELSGGGGIAITLADGTTEIPFEIQSNSAAGTGDLTLWVLLDPLTAASTGDVAAYLYYDSTQSNHDNSAGVYDSDHVAVWHLEEDPSGSAPQIHDSTGNGVNGTSAGSMTSGDLVAARVGNGLDFDGSNDEVNSSSYTAITDHLTLSAWVKGANTADFSGVVSLTSFSLATYRNSANLNLQCYFGGTVKSLDLSAFDGTWHHVAFTYDASTLYGYLDGSQVTSIAATGSINYFGATPTTLNLAKSPNVAFAGQIDEVVLTRATRSADWIAYQYANQNGPSNTFTLGSQETAGGGGGKPFLYYAMMRG